MISPLTSSHANNLFIRKRHAEHFKNLTPRAELVAVSSPTDHELQWAARNLENARLYRTYDEMLEHDGLQAVVVASATSVHAEQTIKAINKGLHVLCEKPLSTSIDVVRLGLISSIVLKSVDASIVTVCSHSLQSFP